MDFVTNDGLERLIEQGLDYSALRQEVLANNIANVNTPRFRRSDVSFKSMMSRSLEQETSGDSGSTTHARHLPIDSPGSKLDTFIIRPPGSRRNDLNNVDMNEEMSEAAKNGMYFQSLTQIASRRFRLMKDTIRGR